MPTFINRAPIPRANRIPLIATTAVQTLCSTENNRADVEIATRLAANLSLGELSNADACKCPASDSFGKSVIETESIVGMKCLLAGRTQRTQIREPLRIARHVSGRGSGTRNPQRGVFHTLNFQTVQSCSCSGEVRTVRTAIAW